jgi:hypothetical protein
MYYYVDEVKDAFKFSKTLFICWLIFLALLCSIPFFSFWVQSNHTTCYAYSACGKDKKESQANLGMFLNGKVNNQMGK